MSLGFHGWLLHANTPQTVSFHSISSIRALSFDQANLGNPASIRGVITLSVEGGLIVHDATEGIWVYWKRFEDYAPGDEVEVQGTIGPGMFAPVVNATTVRKLGIAPLPKPLPVTFKQLSTGAFDAQYVTLIGSIRSVGKRENADGSKHLIVRIDSGNGTLMATLPGDADEPLEHMLDGIVRINRNRNVLQKQQSPNDRSYPGNLQPAEHRSPSPPFRRALVDSVNTHRAAHAMAFRNRSSSPGTRHGHDYLLPPRRKPRD